MARYGHPHFADLPFHLSATRVIVIGNGNITLDLARVLVPDADEIAPTDTVDHPIEALGSSAVAAVIVLGPRGPAQAAFTTPDRARGAGGPD